VLYIDGSGAHHIELNVKGKGRFVAVHAMKSYGANGTLGLDADQWSTSRSSGRFIPWKEPPRPVVLVLEAEWSPRARLEALVKRKSPAAYAIRTPDSACRSLVAVVAPTNWVANLKLLKHTGNYTHHF
jgi:hypothetical protein